MFLTLLTMFSMPTRYHSPESNILHSQFRESLKHYHRNLINQDSWLYEFCSELLSRHYFTVYVSGGQLNTSRGPNLTYRTPSRARSSVSFRRAAREYCLPPKLSQSQTVKKQLHLNLCV
jgi:hypothetical protein